MLACCNPILSYNKKLKEYCNKTLNESILKINDKYKSDKYKIQREEQKYDIVINDLGASNNFNLFCIIGFLSISTIIFYLNNNKQIK